MVIEIGTSEEMEMMTSWLNMDRDEDRDSIAG
jgi:hypothetical protein